MKTIWKYKLEVMDRQQITMPEAAEIIHVAAVQDELCVWVKVDPMRPPETRTFVIVGTGHPIPDDVEHRHAVGTAVFELKHGPFVWHVFEVR